ncbi:MAG: ASKHA domain-containing protein [Thermodesulfobacteriota bacterium]|nr:ASKHA domain-containing protein [Thermodesulfobacteriota bacterium]
MDSRKENKTMSYEIDFQPTGLRGECGPRTSILSFAYKLGLDIVGFCGGKGVCHSCKVKILSGKVTKPSSHETEIFSSEELKQGWRLACQTYPLGRCSVEIPLETMTALQRTQIEGIEVLSEPAPSVRSYQITLSPPTLSDTQCDATRLQKKLNTQEGLTCKTIDLEVLRQISTKLRLWDWECRVMVRDQEVVALRPVTNGNLGIAVDLGTTKIAGYLVDLETGKTLSAKGIMNPQISYGEDIITRLSKSMESHSKAIEFMELASQAINKLTERLCEEVNASKNDIMEAVVVGNTAIHHLFLGLPVRQLARSPYISALSNAIDIKSRDLGLDFASGAYVHLLPNIAGFVGSDHVAALLATGSFVDDDPVLILDIGTNTEATLIAKGKMTSLSCASGPAFEGYQIKHGMRAAEGAIEKIKIINQEVQYQTINNVSPIGICGSGILDAVAQLYLNGIIDKGGRMEDSHPKIQTIDNKRQFILVDAENREGQGPITITQQDIRQLQLAKAAIRGGIQALIETHGLVDEDIGQIIIAGAFGSYIDVKSAMDIGMLPTLPNDRFHQVGNAAGMGAKLALISTVQRAKAARLASKIHYLELGGMPQFMKTFVQASYIGKYRLEKGERKEN